MLLEMKCGREKFPKNNNNRYFYHSKHFHTRSK